MARWPEDTRDRLVATALELFAERGYAGTTVEDIAAQVGVTRRTFFRHFPDKEEVLFADDDRILPVLLDLIADGGVGGTRGPVRADDLMAHVLGTLAEVLEPDRERLRRRQGVIDQNVALTGRELAKQGQWQDAIADALTTRGFPPEAADLLAAIGFVVFRRCLHQWLADTDPSSLGDRVSDALPRVRHVLDTSSGPAATTHEADVEPHGPVTP